MGKLVESWGADCVGKYGYSDVGAVVGATHPEEAERLRAVGYYVQPPAAGIVYGAIESAHTLEAVLLVIGNLHFYGGHYVAYLIYDIHIEFGIAEFKA